MFEQGVLVAAVLGNITIASFAYLKNPQRALNRLLALAAVVISAWSVVNYLSLHQPDPSATLAYVRVVMFFAVLINYCVFLLLKTFPSPNLTITRKAFWGVTGFTALVAGLALSPFLFASVTVKGASIQPNPGPAIPLFLIHTAGLLGAGFVSMVRKFRRARGQDKEQLRLVFYGVLVTLFLIIMSNFVAPLALRTSAFVGMGPAYTFVFIGSIAYAIIRHGLLDIRAAVAKSVAYVLLMGVLGGLYGLAVFSISALFFGGTGMNAGLQAVDVALAVLLAFTFQPLERLVQRLTDRVFYRDHYDSQQVLNRLSTILVLEMNIDRILRDSLKLLCQSLHVGFGQFMVFKDGRIYKVEHFGPLPHRLMIVPNLLKLDRGILVADQLGESEARKIMASHDIRLSATLKTKDELVGFLLLGDKLSGGIYSAQDIELVQIAAKELAVAISNARAYEEIREFNATLQDKVKHATGRLRTANRHLKELDKAKDEFISMASHQLRTPLTTIKGYLSMMLEGDTGDITETQREFITHAYEGSERMVALISDLLNVSRLSAGRFLIEQKPTDVVAMIADEIRQLMPHATAKGLYLKLDPPKGRMPLVDLDENKTRQVIMNFIDNAIYYTQQGGVTVRLRLDNGNFRVEVTDTGIGVPEDAKSHLFTKFFRAGNAQNVRPDGTGLGLYLARRVVYDQGGTIIFESSEGRGSTFGFELPINGTPAHAAKSAPQPTEEKVPTHV